MHHAPPLGRIIPVMASLAAFGASSAVPAAPTAQGDAQETAAPAERRHGAAGREGDGPDTLQDGVQVLPGGENGLRVTPLKGLERPWALAFLPTGDMLVTERPGRLRIVRRDFTLDPEPVSGLPAVLNSAYKGLMDIALHPEFERNGWVYFTYSKALPGEDLSRDWDELTGPAGTAALARGRYDGGHRLEDVEDVFVADAATSGVSAARFVFGADGKIYLSIGAPSRDLARGGTNRIGTSEEAQDPSSHAGKVLRLNDDGSVPDDNPFLGQQEHRPEIFALGLRNPTGIVSHPYTEEIWLVEHGPFGGDEVNIVRAGRNYGWPVVSYGRAYSGERSGAGSGPELAVPTAPGMEEPLIFWSPNVAPGGLTFYTGDRFENWRGDLLIGGLQSTQLHRVDLTDGGLPQEHESLLTSLGQRIREVRQGPDGAIYLLTDQDAGAVLKVEPAGP